MNKTKNKPSYASSAKHKIEGVAFSENYMKSPMGVMGAALFGKLFGRKMSSVELYDKLTRERRTISDMIDRTNKLTRDEKFVLYEILNRFDVYDLREKLKNAQSHRFDFAMMDKHYLMDQYPTMDDISLNTLELRKRKLTKSKSKRKVCKCKKR